MLDLSIIILTFNEEIHLDRCFTKIKLVTDEIFIVDSYSKDRTIEIAKKFTADIYCNKFINQAHQFNWALDNLPIKTKWVMRLDADEYLTPELISEIKEKLPKLDSDITGVVFKRRHIFLNKWIKRGTYPVKLLRLFQYTSGRCEQRWMDEHIVLTNGRAVEFENDFVDHNLNNLTWWSNKHNGYAIREAIELLDIELDLIPKSDDNTSLSEQAAEKRNSKLKYARRPLFLRAFLYFIYRYIFKLGFTEGKEGFLWHFLQGWWYRTLVDAKIYEIKKACGNDKGKIKAYLLKEHNISI